MTQANLFEQQNEPAGDDAETLTLSTFAERAYLDYAVSVVKGRALPDVSDGQKPVQRRILYSMNELGLGPTAKPRKSAAVVGDVLGKLHPHGDQSVYDALVRMAQDFSLRYPLIDGQGNFGSRDGDGAAAMRYTEARLTPISRLLLDEIDMGTVDFQPNYDGSVEEPRTLPARLPMVLLNGASGIAVGMATEIPSHNLREVAAAAVAMIRNPKITHAELMTLVPGPDYPGRRPDHHPGLEHRRHLRHRPRLPEGARALEDRRTGARPVAGGRHRTAAGRVVAARAGRNRRTDQPEDQGGQEDPAARTAGAEADHPRRARHGARRIRPRGPGAPGVRAEVEEPGPGRVHADAAGAYLAGDSAPINLVMIGGDGRPRQKGLSEILQEWVDYRFVTVRRRTEFKLGKVNDRIHILEGRETVLLNIDKVIAIIRNADEPKAALIAEFRLSDRQAEDILEIRLRQLARLEAIKIQQELAELRGEKEKLEDILENRRP
jgi:topoisomerase-4 subunit A